LPEKLVTNRPFEIAASAVEAWLDGEGASFVKRSKSQDGRRKFASWDLQLEHPVLGPQLVRISIPKDFPATPPQVYVDRKLCLVLPHIEMDGRFCHDVVSSPTDYSSPTEAVVAVIESLEKFWNNSSDAEWVTSEFHKERLSYWLRFCEQFRVANAVPTPRAVRVQFRSVQKAMEGKLCAYFQKSHKLRSDLMVATMEEVDPHVLANRHGWSAKTQVRGYSLFVPFADNIRWTPADWPKSLHELESFVAQVTDHEQSVTHWIQSKSDGNPHPFLVVLVQTGVCYGFVVSPALVPKVTNPGIIPVAIDRVDANWALARDHRLSTLGGRQKKRILLLGCGSLGSPVAELLARSGIGELHLLDKETFEAENCGRHILGAQDLGHSKADALAKRLQAVVPDISVKAHRALAADWIHHVCKPGDYDLIVDCTGESSVRVMLSHYRKHSLGACSLIHAWLEPFCAATHVVHLPHGNDWPTDDPGSKLAAATWPDEVQVNLPACGAGFHPYGAADIWQSAGFTTERLLGVLDAKATEAVVWSSVRSQAFFKALGIDVTTGPIVPITGTEYDSVQISRPLKTILSHG
jgi:hypothetical protein